MLYLSGAPLNIGQQICSNLMKFFSIGKVAITSITYLTVLVQLKSLLLQFFTVALKPSL